MTERLIPCAPRRLCGFVSLQRPGLLQRHRRILGLCEAGLPRRGAGRAVLAALMEAAIVAGLHKLTSGVFPENIASPALLKGLGFAEIGIDRRHGKLDGVWRDCVVVERFLDTGDGEDKG